MLSRSLFGFKLANWYAEVQRNIERFDRAAEEMRVGKFFRRGRHVRPPWPRAGRERCVPAWD